MKVVVATGVFDILHPGHILYLDEAKKLGDKLIVIVARDKTIEHRKKPVTGERQRLAVVSALKPVDEAILGDHEDLYKPIMEINPDIVALGRNQHFKEEEIRAELKKRGLKAKVVRIDEHLEGDLNSSSKIVEKIKREKCT
jgi:FAD synthetase